MSSQENQSESESEILRKWTRPENYCGKSWEGYLSAGVGRSRDSDPLERSNFRAMRISLGIPEKRDVRPNFSAGETWDDIERLRTLRAGDSLECSDPTNVDLDGDPLPAVCIVREGHWAVGWVEWIAIHQTDPAAEEARIAARKQAERLENYPILSEDIHSEEEEEDCSKTWATCYSTSDRLEYLKKHVSRKILNKAGYTSLRRAIGGDWGEAASLLPCPSDLIY